MKKIVSIGRGGVGKTSFIALLAVYFKGRKVLLIDADPDTSLDRMLGIDLKENGVNSVSDILFDVRNELVEDNLKTLPLADKIDYLFNRKVLYEGKDLDFITIGTKWTEGCYCQPNNILKGIIAKLENNYDFVLIDSPAGLEHLNRRVTSSVDDIFAILDPSQKAFDNAASARKILSQIGIKFKNFYAVANYRFPAAKLAAAEKNGNFRFLGKIDYDKELEEKNLEGRFVFELKDDSPALVSIGNIMKKAGY